MATHVWSDAAPGGRESLLVYFQHRSRPDPDTESHTARTSSSAVMGRAPAAF